MSEIKANPAVMTAVIQITRKATGKVEEYVLTGTVENSNGSDASDSVSELGSGLGDEHAIDGRET